MNIDDILNAYTDNIVPGTSLKQKTLARMRDAAETPSHNSSSRSRFPKYMRVVLVAALILGLAVIGYATGLLSPETTERFADTFGEKDEQVALIEQMGVPLDISVTSGGITMTAEAMLNDGKVLAVLYKVARENGEPLLPADVEDYKGLVFGSQGSYNQTDYHYAKRLGTEINYLIYTPGETEAYYLHTVEQGNPSSNIYSFSFMNLEAWFTEHGEHLSADPVNDAWRFEFQATPGTESKILVENEIFQKNGEEFRIDFIHVSPLAVRVDYTVLSDTPSNRAEYIYEDRPEGKVLSGMDFHEEAFTDDINLVLRLKDGQEIDMTTITDASGITNIVGYIENTHTLDIEDDEEVFIVHRGAVLPEIIPYDQMDCVIFNDVEYKIP